jgi:uncharacterized repeat protein (TIGR03803 family)
MKRQIFALALALASTLAQPAPDDYWKFELLHSFDTTGPGGYHPLAAVVEVGTGSFWGTNSEGGEYPFVGTVFKFVPGGNLTVKHHFKGGKYGAYPAAPLLVAGGMLYGTTQNSGVNELGTVFKVSTSGVFTRLHSMDVTSGGHPVAPLIQGADGSFYSTAQDLAANGRGAVFRIDAAGALDVVHAFSPLRGGGEEADDSQAPLVLHANGNFYGTASAGGLWDAGSLFKLSPSGDFTLLHSFLGGNDPLGCAPRAGLTLAADGSMVGVNSDCGSLGGGTLFKLSPEGTVTLLHTLSPRSDGTTPLGGLAQGSDGRFYGTASAGAWGCGTVFSKSANPRGTFKVLHVFAANGDDGCDPRGTLTLGTDGAFYGTTREGGASDVGTIFRLRHIVDFPPQ